MSDFTLVDPNGWVYDLHSVYSAYIGYFQVNNISWYERSWGHLFSSFDQFLAFSWPVITVTDAWSGKPHIVTRLTSIGAFIKMIKTRFGEVLQQAPNMLVVTPFETGNRHLRNVSDATSYNKLYSTLPAVVLSAFKVRIKAGEYKATRDIWDGKDKTFLAIDFEWSQRNEKSCLEWGYAAVRCGHLNDLGHWPPEPDNYRRGHFIVEEYVDKVINRYCPTYPWDYAFGDSQVLSKSKLPQVIQAVISSLASPDSSTTPNSLVLVGHGITGDIARLEEMKIKLPHNVLIIDTAVFDRVLHSTGRRGIMIDPRTNNPRNQGNTLSLENLVRSLVVNPMITPPSPQGSNRSSNGNGKGSPTTSRTPLVLPNVKYHNAGNDAFMCLFAFQMLLNPLHTNAPTIKKGRIGRRVSGGTPGVPLATTTTTKTTKTIPRPHSMAFTSPVMMTHPYATTTPTNQYDLAAEFGQMRTGQWQQQPQTQPLTTRTTGIGMYTVLFDGEEVFKRTPGSGGRRGNGR